MKEFVVDASVVGVSRNAPLGLVGDLPGVLNHGTEALKHGSQAVSQPIELFRRKHQGNLNRVRRELIRRAPPQKHANQVWVQFNTLDTAIGAQALSVPLHVHLVQSEGDVLDIEFVRALKVESFARLAVAFVGESDKDEFFVRRVDQDGARNKLHHCYQSCHHGRLVAAAMPEATSEARAARLSSAN